MIEWYRAHAPYEALMDDVAALLPLAARIGGVARFQWRGRVCDPFAPPERLTVEEAFLRHAGFSLLATTESTEERNREAIAYKANTLKVRIVDDDTWSDVFSRILSERIEPALGLGRPTILMEYPIAEAALARPKPADPRVAERFELYVSGVELANAFCELTDPVEQRRRFEADMALKQAIYGERYPLDEELLAALSLMPPTSGIALGFDRLAMLAVGAETIADVIWTPVAEGPMSGP
jgi:lysyl-tRNA synthetase class 2